MKWGMPLYIPSHRKNTINGHANYHVSPQTCAAFSHQKAGTKKWCAAGRGYNIGVYYGWRVKQAIPQMDSTTGLGHLRVVKPCSGEREIRKKWKPSRFLIDGNLGADGANSSGLNVFVLPPFFSCSPDNGDAKRSRRDKHYSLLRLMSSPSQRQAETPRRSSRPRTLRTRDDHISPLTSRSSNRLNSRRQQQSRHSEQEPVSPANGNPPSSPDSCIQPIQYSVPSPSPDEEEDHFSLPCSQPASILLPAVKYEQTVFEDILGCLVAIQGPFDVSVVDIALSLAQPSELPPFSAAISPPHPSFISPPATPATPGSSLPPVTLTPSAVFLGLDRSAINLRASFLVDGVQLEHTPTIGDLLQTVIAREQSTPSRVLAKLPSDDKTWVATSKVPIDIKNDDYRDPSTHFRDVGSFRVIFDDVKDSPRIAPAPLSATLRSYLRSVELPEDKPLFVVYVYCDNSSPCPEAGPGMALLPTSQHPTRATWLTRLYPQYDAILDGLKLSKYGKAYVHCQKYRIINAMEKGQGEAYHDTIVLWAHEVPKTWKNTMARCKRAAAALAKLGEHSSKQPLMPDQDHVFQLFKVLLGGPIQLLAFSQFIPTEGVANRSWLEWQKLKVESEALNMTSKKLEDLSKMVEAWFPSSI